MVQVAIVYLKHKNKWKLSTQKEMEENMHELTEENVIRVISSSEMGTERKKWQN